MSTWKIKKRCLSCRHYRVIDVQSGVCRVDRKTIQPHPMKLHDDICERWKDCGQQYYIRTGWIKAQKEKPKDDSSH